MTNVRWQDPYFISLMVMSLIRRIRFCLHLQCLSDRQFKSRDALILHGSLSKRWDDNGIKGVKLFQWTRECLLATLVLSLSACYWSGPWPRGTDYNQCLGQGQIASYFETNCCDFTEEWITERAKEMLLIARSTLPPRESAQSIGMQCLSSPSRICVYKGEKGWTIDNPPSDRPD